MADDKIYFRVRKPGDVLNPVPPEKTFKVYMKDIDVPDAVDSNQEIIFPLKKPGDGVPLFIEVMSDVSCCENPGYYFYYGYNPSRISPAGFVTLYVVGGCPPFDWTVNKAGYSFTTAQTEERWNTLVADAGTAQGDVLVTITDFCGNQAVGTVRNEGVLTEVIDSLIDSLFGNISYDYLTAEFQTTIDLIAVHDNAITVLNVWKITTEGELVDINNNIVDLGIDIDTINTTLAQAQDAINSAETLITIIQGDLDSAEALIAQLQSDLSGIDGRLSTAEIDIDAAEGNITLLTTNLDATNDTIALLSIDLDAVEATITIMATDIDVAEGNISTLQIDLDAAEAAISLNATNIDTVNDDVTSLSLRMDAAEGEIALNVTDINTLEGDVLGLTVRMSVAEGSIIVNANDIDTVGGEVINLDLRLDTAEASITLNASDIDTAEGNITALGIRMDAAEADILINATDISNAEDRISVVEIDLDAAESTLSLVSAKANTNETNVTSLQLRMDAAEGSIVINASDIDTIAGDVTTLQIDLDTAEGQITLINTSINTLTNDLSNLDSDVNDPTTGALALIAAAQIEIDANTADLANLDSTITAAVQVALAPYNLDDLDTWMAGVELTLSAHTDDLGDLMAEFFVKLDVNGYISGFGISGQTDYTEAIFFVDKFKIVTPGETPVQMFAVGLIDGISSVGIDGQLIVDQSILARHLSVTTAVITDEAQIATAIINSGHIDSYLVSSDFDGDTDGDPAGSNGWLLTMGGLAIFNDVMIRNSIASFGYNGSLDGSSVGTTGFCIAIPNNKAIFHDIYARGNIEATSLNATSANIVDTINLSGDAVIVPAHNEVDGDITLSSSYQSIVSQALDSSGQPVLIIASFNVRFGNNSLTNNGKVTITAKIAEGANTIFEGEVYSATSYEVRDATEEGFHREIDGLCNITIPKNYDPTTGIKTYIVSAKATDTTGALVNVYASLRQIVIIGMKVNR